MSKTTACLPMPFHCRNTLSVAVLLLGIALVGCSSIEENLPDRRADYKRARSVDTLEVPPDLTASTIDDSLVVPELGPAGTATFSDYSKERAQGTQVRQDLLPEPENVRLMRDGQARWLVVNASAQDIWPRLRRFWEDVGLPVALEDPITGVVETEWVENRADVPQGFITDLLRKVADAAYSADTRDKFRVRLEPGREPGTTELYLTHYGVVEVESGPAASVEYIWQPRPRDPELEAIMMRRLMVFLGADEERARALLASRPEGAAPRSTVRLSPDGEPYLSVAEPVARSWRLVGIALDASNFLIEDRDPDALTFIVKYRSPVGVQENKGVLSKLAFWKDDDPEELPFQVKLSADSSTTTRVTVHDEDGNLSRADTAQVILESLNGELQ